MEKQTVLAKLKDHWADIQHRFSVKDICLFGSVARGEITAHSDVDLLVTFMEKANFDTFMDLKSYLEDLLGTNVDLVTAKALRPQIRQAIDPELIHVA